MEEMERLINVEDLDSLSTCLVNAMRIQYQDLIYKHLYEVYLRELNSVW